MPSADNPPSSISKVRITQSESGQGGTDSVVVEEPLEIRLRQAGVETQLGITMRTPGADLELAAGFLWGEGFLTSTEDLLEVKVCADRSLTPRQRANVVIATISDGAPTPPRQMERRFTMTSACGVCGSSNISDLRARGVANVAPTPHELSILAGFPEFLNGRQAIFTKTGGLHAAVLIDENGKPVIAREDVGRHNAVDKVIGAMVMQHRLPLSGWSLVASGRIGYEIVQKAICAGASAIIGVSAPTSLAIEVADEFGLTLMAFARDGKAKRFNTL